MAYEINWNVAPNSDMLKSPIYQKWSTLTVQECKANEAALIADLGAIKVNLDSAPVISYLSWLSRIITFLD